MRTRILALIIVAIMIFPTSFAAFAASEVVVGNVMFTDADMTTELATLYDCSEGIGCSFSYQAPAGTTAYGMLMLKKNGQIVTSVEQEFLLEASGIAAFDEIINPDFSEVGVYEAVFMLFDSKENKNLAKGSDAKIVCEIYPEEYNATRDMGFDFEDESLKSNMSYYRASGSADNGSTSISTDYAKHGISSFKVPVLKAWDRFFPNSTLSSGKIVKNCKALGDGTYRVSGYIYPTSEALTFSPRLIAQNTKLNSGKEYNFTQKVTAEPGKWTYFSVDYVVEGYFDDNLTRARHQIQIETTLKAEQYVYLDDFKLIKLEEGLEEMTTVVNTVVKAKAKSGETVVVAAESEDEVYAIEAVTADENGVVEAQLSLSEGFESEDITINVYGSEKLSQNMAEGLMIEDVSYVDFRYFGLPEKDGVKINSVSVNYELMPYDSIYLPQGDVAVTLDIKNDEEKSLRIVAARYNNGMFKSSTISAAGENEIIIEGIEAHDYVEFFLVDDNMTIMSHMYTLSEDGLTETEIYDSVAEFEELPVAYYNTINASVEFDVNADKDSFVLIAAYPSDKTDADDYAYIGLEKLNKGDNHVSLPIDKDRYEDSCTFNADYYTTSADVYGSFAPFDYVGEKELIGYYETVNNPDAKTTDIYNVISSKVLKINLDSYNSLSSKPSAQTRVLQLFIEYNDKKDITGAAQIQHLLDEALATVILSVNPDADSIETLGDKIPLNEEFFKDYKKETDEFKKEVASLVKANAVSAEEASKEKANEIFEEAYLTAQFTYNAQTYGAFMQLATETYADKLNLDLSKLGSSDSSDVFKYMFKNRKDIKNIADIKNLYLKAIDAAEDDDSDSGSSSGGRKSGGGGGGGTYVKPSEEKTNEQPASQRTKFTDMADSHWAIESVLFLNGIGVISDSASYRPDDSITREEVVKMLICSFGELDENAECDFSDVTKDSWSYPYVASAFKAGMVNGVGENIFGSGRNISRQDALVMIYRIVKDKLEAVSEDYVFEFSDADSVADYAEEAVKALCANGIVNGYEDGTFRPEASISRAECAKLLTTVFRR